MSTFCPHCGKPTTQHARFCAHCGEKLDVNNKEEPTTNNDSVFIGDDIDNIPNPNNNEPPPPLPPRNKQNTSPKRQQLVSNKAQPAIPNPQHTYALIGLFISGAGALSVALAAMEVVDMMHGGGAMIMVGILFFIMGFVVFGIFKKRARVLDAIINGSEVIASWSYNERLWREFTERERSERGSQNKATFILIAIFTVLICGGMLLYTGFDDASITVSLFMGGFLVFLAGIAFLAVWLPYRRRSLMRGGRLIISLKGMWLEGDFYEWASFGMRLEAIEYDSSKRLLVIQISAINRTGRDYQTLHFPVPEGEEETAKMVVEKLWKNRG